MPEIGVKTENKRCKKCQWCAKYDDFNVLQNTHMPVYYCTVGDFHSKRKPEMKPNIEGECPCYGLPYKDEVSED